MRNIKVANILEGHLKELFNVDEELYKERFTACQKCEHNKKSVIGDICDLCGCRLDAKLRVSEEHCKLNKW